MVVHMEIWTMTIKKCNVRIRYARIGKAKVWRPFNLVPAEAVIQEVWMFYLLIRCQVCYKIMGTKVNCTEGNQLVNNIW